MEEAIAGLAGRGERLPQLGKLRKGGEKRPGRPGEDLTYFRAQFAAAFEGVAAWFEEEYGPEPNDLRVSFPFRTIRENFQHGFYRFTRKGVRFHQCDGVKVRFAMNPHTGEVLVHNGEDVKTGEKVYCTLRYNPDQNKRCAPGGRLSVFLLDSGAFAVMKVLTGSINDIRALEALIGGYYDVFTGMGRREGLAAVPFILSRRDAWIWAPIGDGGRNVRIEKNLLTIRLDPAAEGPYLDAFKMIGDPAFIVEQASRKGWAEEDAEPVPMPHTQKEFRSWVWVLGYNGEDVVAALDGLEPDQWVLVNKGGYMAAAEAVRATLRARGE